MKYISRKGYKDEKTFAPDARVTLAREEGNTFKLWKEQVYDKLVEGEVIGVGYTVVKRYPHHMLLINPHGHKESFHPTDVRRICSGLTDVGFKYNTLSTITDVPTLNNGLKKDVVLPEKKKEVKKTYKEQLMEIKHKNKQTRDSRREEKLEKEKLGDNYELQKKREEEFDRQMREQVRIQFGKHETLLQQIRRLNGNATTN